MDGWLLDLGALSALRLRCAAALGQNGIFDTPIFISCGVVKASQAVEWVVLLGFLIELMDGMLLTDFSL